MKDTFQTIGTCIILLVATAFPLQGQAESPQFKLFATEIPQLRVEKGTKLSDVILLLEKDWGISINAIFQGDAGDAPVPKLDLQNVSFIDLLEVIETLTHVSTNVISNSPSTDPIVCFKAPQSVVAAEPLPGTAGILDARDSSTITMPSLTHTGQSGETEKAPASPETALENVTPTIDQPQPTALAPVDSAPTMRVFPLSDYDIAPEDILDFVEQFLMLGSTKDVDRVAAVRSLYHKGTNSLILRGSLSDLNEIKEALEQLSGKASRSDPFGAPLSDAGTKTSDPFGGGGKTPAPDPFGAVPQDAGTEAADPFGGGGENASQKKKDRKASPPPASAPKENKKNEAADDPFGA